MPEEPHARLPDWRTPVLGAVLPPLRGADAERETVPSVRRCRTGRCRMHGGKSTGPRTPEGLARIRAAQTTHGMRTAEMEQMRKLVRELRAGAKRLVEMT